MKTIQLKLKPAISAYWRIGRYKGKIITGFIFLVVSLTAPLTAAALKILPAISLGRTNQATTVRHLPKPQTVESPGNEHSASQERVPTKTEKLLSIIVGVVFPVSILSLLFFMQYASNPLTDKLFFDNKSS